VRGFYGLPGFAVEQADMNGTFRLGVKAGAENGSTQEADEGADDWHMGFPPAKGNSRFPFDSDGLP
ncbi:MAG TPA: hypothetical protein VJX73_04730, partial [Terracidiphilus sp.]|nr:hypothetical protein [Terracidiphilus sp.]